MRKYRFLIVALLLSSFAGSHTALAHQSNSSTTNGPASAVPAPSTVSDDNSPRNVDDRQLNDFAVELKTIDINATKAKAQIKDLASRVEAFHQALFARKYNAMDILKDTEDLQKRIEETRQKLPKKAPAPKPAAVSPSAQ